MLYLNLLRFLQLRRSAASTVSQIVAVKPALRLLSGLTGKCFLMPYAPYNLPLYASVKRQKKPNRTKQHICKPLQASPAIQSLQKSCFFACATLA